VERVPDTGSERLGLRLGMPASIDESDEPNVTPWTVIPEDYGDFLIGVFDEWVKNDIGADGTTNDIVSYWDYPSSRSWVLTHHRNNQYFFEIAGKGNIAGGTVNTNWNHVAAAYDGTRMRLYVNGNEVNSRSASGSLPGSSADFIIGSQADGSNFFDGTIDEVAVWDRALSPTEIQGLQASISCGCTELSDVIEAIENWKQGSLTISGVMQVIQRWKDGC
jgi:hypothetical protein